MQGFIHSSPEMKATATTDNASHPSSKKWMKTEQSNGNGNSSKDQKKKMPPLKVSSFLKTDPWLLVPDGNLLGFFTWVPEHLRIGPWSKAALPSIILLTSMIAYHSPMEDQFYTEVASYPPARSPYWWYNIFASCFMIGVCMQSVANSSWAICLSFTLLSWNMNALRHGIHALAPFLSDHHPLLKLNHILRFPALVSATITFVIWNFVLVPALYVMMITREKKDNFAIWNTNSRLVQFHCCNMIYATLNTMVTGNREGVRPPLFDAEDLWYGLAYGLVYSLFYVFVLDRIGVHLYPIFSPRSKYFPASWGMAFVLYYSSFLVWNYALAHHWDILNFYYLVAFNLVLVGVGFAAHYMLSYMKQKRTAIPSSSADADVDADDGK